jgi:hypothetical protein
MGQKTIEEIGKILLVSIISILISVMATRRVLLDRKLDKIEFDRYVDKHDARHDREMDNVDKKLDLILELIKKDN